MNTIWLIIAIILILPGILGVFLPILPGIPYMFLIAFVYGLVTHFHTLTGHELTILGIIALASVGVDYLAGVIGAKYGGASRRSMLFGFVGLILGTIIFPPFGAIIGLFLGILVGELSAHNNQHKAVKAAASGVIGVLAGNIINLLLSITFIILFIIFSVK